MDANWLVTGYGQINPRNDKIFLEKVNIVDNLKRLVQLAQDEEEDAVAHGSTGKGNDQLRFESMEITAWSKEAA